MQVRLVSKEGLLLWHINSTCNRSRQSKTYTVSSSFSSRVGCDFNLDSYVLLGPTIYNVVSYYKCRCSHVHLECVPLNAAVNIAQPSRTFAVVCVSRRVSKAVKVLPQVSMDESA